MGFTKAVKKSAKLRMALIGASGTGKTYTALTLASALANGQPVAVVDTERGSASKYADLFDFDVLELSTFHPTQYVQAIQEAVTAGYAVVVIDSLSHAWYGTNGLLELVAKQGKTFDAWSRVKPIENALIDALTGSPIHIIATMRSKVAYEVEKDPTTGKATPRKVGTAAIQREGIEYEFDIAGELDQGNTLTISKSRCPALAEAVIAKPGKQVAATLAAWLSGASETPANNPAPAQATRTASAAPAAPKAAPKPAPAQTPAQPASNGATDKFAELRERAAVVGVRDNDWAVLAQTKGGTSDPARITAPGLKNLERHIAGLEAAKAEATAKLTRPAAPTPSADELAAAQADYNASQTDQDFPSPANDYDLSKLPMGAMPS